MYVYICIHICIYLIIKGPRQWMGAAAGSAGAKAMQKFKGRH
jgi:hypothetical protein